MPCFAYGNLPYHPIEYHPCDLEGNSEYYIKHMSKDHLQFFAQLVKFILSGLRNQSKETIPIPYEYTDYVWVNPFFHYTMREYDTVRLPIIERIISLVTDCMHFPEGKSAELMRENHAEIFFEISSNISTYLPMEE